MGGERERMLYIIKNLGDFVVFPTLYIPDVSYHSENIQ